MSFSGLNPEMASIVRVAPPNQAEIEQRVAEYAKLLRIQDWQIKVGVVRRRALTEWHSYAHVNYLMSRQIAVIQLLAAEDVVEEDVAPYDWEENLVHELAHIMLADLTNVDEEKGIELDSTQEERVVNRIAQALVSQQRLIRTYEICRQPTKTSTDAA
jgi:hypothetical protein